MIPSAIDIDSGKDYRDHRVVTLPGPYATVGDVIEKNIATGHHFFDPASKRFFGSRVPRSSAAMIHGRFFITSEQCPYSTDYDTGAIHTFPRLYTVRVALDDGTVSDLGGFQAHETAEAARRYLREQLDAVAVIEARDAAEAAALDAMNTAIDDPAAWAEVIREDDYR